MIRFINQAKEIFNILQIYIATLERAAKYKTKINILKL